MKAVLYLVPAGGFAQGQLRHFGPEETAHHKKNLLGYVLDRDTAHVVIEWRRVEEGRFADEEALLTGLAAEWRDGRRPAEPKPRI
jgi:hypothetical protein